MHAWGGKGARVGFRFLHSEYKHVLLLSVHWGRGKMVHERNVGGMNIDALAKKTVSDLYA
jgi:hypothetical protein